MGDSEEEAPLLSVTSPPSGEKSIAQQEGPSLVYRWIMLFFICVLTFGSYFVFDNPGALQNQLMEVRNCSLG